VTKVISINEGTINSDKMTEAVRRYIGVRAEVDCLKEDLKEIVKQAADESKLDKKLINKYLGARYKAQTKEVAEQGELFAAIDNLIDS
jgi:cobalamin biosynthesis protein CbiG